MNDVRPANRTVAWHEGTAANVLASLQSSSKGLTADEAAERLPRDGPNELPKPRQPGALLIFAGQFKNPLVYLLLAAAVVSLLVGDLLDSFFILVILLFNALIGAVQEWQAQRGAAALDQLVPHRAAVRRDGVWVEIDAPDLVIGDPVELETGHKVCAIRRRLSPRSPTDPSVVARPSSDARRPR